MKRNKSIDGRMTSEILLEEMGSWVFILKCAASSNTKIGQDTGKVDDGDGGDGIPTRVIPTRVHLDRITELDQH